MQTLLAPPKIRGKCVVGKGEVLEYDLYYITRTEELWHMYAWLRKQTSIGLDVETDGSGKVSSPWKLQDGLNHRTNKLATVQVGNPKVGRAYVLCMRSLGAITMQPDGTWMGHPEVIRPLLDVLEDESVYILGQNVRFEQQWFLHAFGTWITKMVCCQLAELVMRAGLWPVSKSAAGKTDEVGVTDRAAYRVTSMAALGKRYLGIEVAKGEELRMRFWTTPPGQLSIAQREYAAGDVFYPYYLFREQKKELKQRGLLDIADIDFELIPVLVDSQIFGMYLDQTEWKKLWQEAIVLLETAKAELDDFFRQQSEQLDMLHSESKPVRPTQVMKRKETRDLNYNAPAQVKKAFVDYCKRIDWPYELVTSWQRLLTLKKQYGQEWLDKHPDKSAKEVPQYLVPETKYCILLKMEGPELRLYSIKGMLPSDLVAVYLRYKEAHKRESTYGMKFLNDNVSADSCVHTYFHLGLTSTGRLSSEPNLQNIPRDPRYRACFKPRPGYKYIIADYSQIEPRLTAEASGDPVYVQTFKDGADIYCRIGEAISGTPIDKKKDKARRQMYKTLGLALAYNMGPGKLLNGLILDLAPFIKSGEVNMPTFFEALDLHKAFFASHQGVRAYQRECIAQATPQNPSRPKIWDSYVGHAVTWVTGLCGRKRFFPEDCLTTYTEAPNAPIQGTSATITKIAAIMLMKETRKRGLECHIVNLVHDELIVEVPNDQAAEVRDIVKDRMEAAGRRYIKSVPVIAEFPETSEEGICTHWIKE